MKDYDRNKESSYRKDTVMKIDKARINDCLRVSKVS